MTGSLVAAYDGKRHFLDVSTKQFYDQRGQETEGSVFSYRIGTAFC